MLGRPRSRYSFALFRTKAGRRFFGFLAAPKSTGRTSQSSRWRHPTLGSSLARFSIKLTAPWPDVNEQGRLRSVEQTGYHVVLKPDPEGGYVAVVPAFPGCCSRGETPDEALSNARDAILLTMEDLRERGDTIPDPAGELARRVAVGANEGSPPFDHMGIPPKPDEFSAESDPLAWEGEGWS